MSFAVAIAPVFLDRMIDFLIPLFLTSVGGDAVAARHAARDVLASFSAETEEEMRLCAEITSFGFGALEALARSMDPDLPLNAVLRLRGSANAMHRSGHQCQRALDRLRAARQAGPAAAVTRPAAATESASPVVAPILSRQQRRALQRTAEKAQRQRSEQARRDALRASRMVSKPGGQAAAVPLRAPGPTMDRSRHASMSTAYGHPDAPSARSAAVLLPPDGLTMDRSRHASMSTAPRHPDAPGAQSAAALLPPNGLTMDRNIDASMPTPGYAGASPVSRPGATHAAAAIQPI